MDFWLVDVKSTVIVKGKYVVFDYINTYCELNAAIEYAKTLSDNKDVLEVSVHHWILKKDGSQEHAENGGKSDVPYHFLNREHRELKG